MKHINYYYLSDDEKEKFIKFLTKASSETFQPAHNNMDIIDWEQKPNTLLYVLEKTDRFKSKGIFHILVDEENVVACSGAYTSDICPELAIIGCRTWIDIEYRNQLISREYLLPYEREWALSNNFKAIALTFNEYNKNIMKLWYRNRLGESRTPRKSYHFGFNGITCIEEPVYIQYTKQYLMYEKLDSSWDYNWDDIIIPT